MGRHLVSLARTMSARFDIVRNTAKELVLRDRGGESRSITNDAERVVAFLLLFGFVGPGKRLTYYDTMGERSRLLFNQDGFTGFLPIGHAEHRGNGAHQQQFEDRPMERII